MFSTNLPTETLYKTSFTLGIIIFVFSVTYRIECNFKISNLRNDYIHESIIAELNDSIQFEELLYMNKTINSIISDLNGYDEILNSKSENKKVKELVLIFEPLKKDSLSIYKKSFDLLQSQLLKNKLNIKKNDKKYIVELQKYKSFIEWQSIVLICLSLSMAILGLYHWRKIQIVSDKTAKINLEKLQFEFELLKGKK